MNKTLETGTNHLKDRLLKLPYTCNENRTHDSTVKGWCLKPLDHAGKLKGATNNPNQLHKNNKGYSKEELD